MPVRAGDRLASSPLRLVPTDFRPPTEAEPEPGGPDRPADAAAPIDPTEANLTSTLRRRAKAIAGRRPARANPRSAPRPRRSDPAAAVTTPPAAASVDGGDGDA